MYESEAVRNCVKSPVVKDALPSLHQKNTYKDPYIVVSTVRPA